MSQHPAYSPKNAYSAAKQQQHTGPIIVGATAVTATTGTASARTSTATKATAVATANAATANNDKITNKTQPEGRHANESLAILASYAFSSVKNKKRGRADYVNDLERLVPPLLLCANNSTTDDGEGGSECKRHTKKIRGNLKISESDVTSTDENGQPDETPKIHHHEQLQKELKQCKQENVLLMNRRSNFFNSVVALHELYETGLDGISRMNDMRFVPDNVMPDKVPR